MDYTTKLRLIHPPIPHFHQDQEEDMESTITNECAT